MKKKIVGFFTFFFGGIGVLSMSRIMGTNIKEHYIWEASDSYYAVMIASSIIALVLYWKRNSMEDT